MLSEPQIEAFVRDGFLHLPEAFPRDLAAACVDALWAACGVDRDTPSSWTQPVVRVIGSGAPPLIAAINSERLTSALDQLAGVGRWQRRTGYGSFPIRFPSENDPGDAGWHVDGSFEIDGEPPPWNYGVNIRSKNRALLVLMLYSDTTLADAPTRIRVGSHIDIARKLAPFGEAGLSFMKVSHCPEAESRPIAHAVGAAGDAYICHPFLLHSASWPHRGTAPRFMGQPCIHFQPPLDGYDYQRPDGAYAPCEQAVMRALST